MVYLRKRESREKDHIFGILRGMNYPLIQSVGIVVFDGENVLLVRHGKAAHHFEGVCGLPSGKVDPGEQTIDTAKRELQEETGLVCEINDLVPLPKAYQATIEQKDGIKIFDWYVFLCKKYSGSLKTSDETEPFWVPVSKLEEMELLPNVLDAVMKARKM